MKVSRKYTEFVEGSQQERVHKGSSVKDLLNGNILGREVVFKQLPFLFFLTMFGIIYIGNRYHAEKVIQQKHYLQEEVKELRAQAISIEAKLMHISTQSEIIKLLNKKNLHLQKPKKPPKVLLINKSEK